MIECFFDDSGTESALSNRFVVIAGYLTHESYWYVFNQKWRHLLIRHGLPKLHMKEWVKFCEEREWDHPKRHSVVSEFIQVIRDTQLIGFGVAVDAQIWRELTPKRRKAFGNAQEFCFQRIMRRVVDRMEEAQERDPVSIIFDRDFQFARPRLGLLEHLYKTDTRLAQQVASISFSDSRYYYQLQAADLLAWVTRKRLIDEIEEKPSTPKWDELFADLPYGELDYAGEYWDSKEIEKHFSVVEADHEKMKKLERIRSS